ncbi:MAG: hypothetical protein ACYTG5_19890, partial [Planctomycetota bacterium]
MHTRILASLFSLLVFSASSQLLAQEVIDVALGSDSSNGNANVIWRDQVLIRNSRGGWKRSDGTQQGTVDIPSLADVGTIFPCGNQFFALRGKGPYSAEFLRVSSDLNTVDVIGSSGSIVDGPRDVMTMGDRLIFTMGANLLKVWVTDLNAGSMQSIVDDANLLAVLGNQALVLSLDGELMVTDG